MRSINARFDAEQETWQNLRQSKVAIEVSFGDYWNDHPGMTMGEPLVRSGLPRVQLWRFGGVSF
jgi:hypothetical protein